ncbi:hypothetical protein [Kiloniella antarctica]|uniref:Uncharacterized protein n=1 Tax=Kiloniella antarctica TaxID=1550907 RepID=A0ABW5BJ64_9PROT
MQIGGAGSFPLIDRGGERGKEAHRLAELGPVQKVEREKFAQSEARYAENKATTLFSGGAYKADFTGPSNGIPSEGAQAMLASSQTSQTLFFAQQIASAVPEANLGAKTEPTKTNSHKDAVEAYRDIVGKTPGERMRAQVLRSLGLTEEQLEQLPPDERKKVEEQISQLIDEKVKSSVAEGIAEQEAGGDTASKQKDGSGFEQALVAQRSSVKGYETQIQTSENKDELHKNLMNNMI